MGLVCWEDVFASTEKDVIIGKVLPIRVKNSHEISYKDCSTSLRPNETGIIDKTLKKIVKNNEADNPQLRYLVRKSGTEPLIRILIEGYNKDKVINASKILNNQIKKALNAR